MHNIYYYYLFCSYLLWPVFVYADLSNYIIHSTLDFLRGSRQSSDPGKEFHGSALPAAAQRLRIHIYIYIIHVLLYERSLIIIDAPPGQRAVHTLFGRPTRTH